METTHVSIHHPDNIKNTQYNVSQPCYFIRVDHIYKEMDQVNFVSEYSGNKISVGLNPNIINFKLLRA